MTPTEAQARVDGGGRVGPQSGMAGGGSMMRQVMAGLFAALTIAGAAQAQESTAVRRESHAVRGLAQPAELVVDRWGIPHIYAKSARDAFFLQGWNAARDRLWQIDLWRKR